MAITRSIAYKVYISDIAGGDYVKQEGFNPNYVELAGRQVSRVNLIATVVGKFLSDDGNYGALTLDDGTETIRIKAFGPDVAKIADVEIGQLIRAVAKIKEYNEERYLASDFVAELKDPNWLIVQKLELGEPTAISPQPIASSDELPQRFTSDAKRKPLHTSKKDVFDVPEKPKEQEAEEKEETKPTKEVAKEKDKQEEQPAEETEPKVKDKEKKEDKKLTAESSELTAIPDFIAIISKLDSGEGAEMQKVIEKSKLSEDEAKTHIVELLKQGEVYEPRKGKLKVL